MSDYTIGQVARMAGISVRALHHYDEIGLLVPVRAGGNDYRIYGERELLRLQQILIHRELGMPLNEIGAVLDDPGFDRLEALKAQRCKLALEADRYQTMVTTIDRTIAELEGQRKMNHARLYDGIVSPEKQAQYEEWLIERFGEPVRAEIEAGRRTAGGSSSPDMRKRMQELEPIEQDLAKAMLEGLPPEARALDPQIERHRDWVATMWGKPCDAQAYAGVADVYLDHADFTARFETVAPGFAEWLPAAMKAWAKRQDD